MNSETQIENQLKLVDETIEYYINNPRSLNTGSGCLYCGLNGERCAAARLFVNPDVLTDSEYWGEETTSISNPRLILKPQYDKAYLNDKFIFKLQKLHDEGENWNLSHGKNKLTKIGDLAVQDFKLFIKNGKYLNKD